tara:strand:- start:145 stop:1074 length:930 start_codon:yes stop_codon:yes gene_type:complete
MNIDEFFDPKKSLELYGLKNYFKFIRDLYDNKNLPKVLLLSGEKGLGKSTLVNHILYYIFDRKNYNFEKNSLNHESSFYKQFKKNIFPNIIYLSGSTFKNIKVDEIRSLKRNILKTSLSKKLRFIIFDEIDIFNKNSLNALLKIIEEPGQNNSFILINNRTKILLETVKSRCIEIKIHMNTQAKIKVTDQLLNKFDLSKKLNSYGSISPGNFIKLNYLLENDKFDINQNYNKNLNKLINLYKKDKEEFYNNVILLYTDYYFENLMKKKVYPNQKIIDDRVFTIKSINDFFIYKLNQNTLLTNINERFNA